MSYLVTGALAVVTDDSGVQQYYYEGALISSISEESAAHLVESGLIEDLGDDFVVVVPVDEFHGDGEPVKPAKAGPVKAWEDYAVALHEFTGGARGLSREDAEAANKQELIELFA